mmetsp:Transcript_30816/g.67599  ORF Transcript_30816/g.67599 Transcript_30816/m.67599 type:complete len:215 (-) Transcript_30816:898-1542(-)
MLLQHRPALPRQDCLAHIQGLRRGQCPVHCDLGSLVETQGVPDLDELDGDRLLLGLGHELDRVHPPLHEGAQGVLGLNPGIHLNGLAAEHHGHEDGGHAEEVQRRAPQLDGHPLHRGHHRHPCHGRHLVLIRVPGARDVGGVAHDDGNGVHVGNVGSNGHQHVHVRGVAGQSLDSVAVELRTKHKLHRRRQDQHRHCSHVEMNTSSRGEDRRAV